MIDSQLSCQVPADRVRALYPVLFNIPVQNHDELVALATAVAQRAEELMPGAALCAKAQQYLQTLKEVERGGGVGPEAGSRRSSGHFRSRWISVRSGFLSTTTSMFQNFRSDMGFASSAQVVPGPGESHPPLTRSGSTPIPKTLLREPRTGVT
mmetsp:Transcript_9386/g.26795  ORF Transcript_9386/g.26795 Transcript_9386/m.26795 type:complete len:153 (+) Transcript_9386:1791-2249(+)